MNKKVLALTSFVVLFSCGGSNLKTRDITVSKLENPNPEPNIPLECYTDTGIVKEGRAIANPCYVCHTMANTPFANEVEDAELTLSYDFPEEIKNTGNPWLNAVRPDLTIRHIPVPADEEIKNWIRGSNWQEAYGQRGVGDLEYFPDIPPIYSYEEGSYRLVNIDDEGFIHDEGGNLTGWRAFKWKPFPGFFPTNGRIDSTFIRLPEKFRAKNGVFDKETYKKNLAILECAVKGVQVGELCSGTEVGDFELPAYYEGDARDVPVVTYQYPPGTEFAHPIYYLDPENTISFKSLRIKEMRYMKKLAYADARVGGEEEEEEEGSFFWDKGRFFNDSGYWEMRAFIEDENGNLRPQTAQESKFCIACHGGIAGTVDGTFTYWRKVPGVEGWMDQDYNLTDRSIRDWAYARLSEGNIGTELKKALGSYLSSVGEYRLYFAMTDGGDHFRSNREVRGRISQDPEKISFVRSPNDNILNNPALVKYLDNQGYIKPELFLPSEERALSIDKQYYRIVKAQAFVFGRDVFGGPFGISSGGNSLEDLSTVETTGVKEAGIWSLIKTLLKF